LFLSAAHLDSIPSPSRHPGDVSPVLTFYFFSRRFEYASDEAGLALTHDPENAIRALANLYRITQAPVHFDRLTELFMTHPPLTRRVRAIAESGAMPAERLSEVIDEMEVRGVVWE